VCYDHGGTEPTITDVDAILGYLNADSFLGGRAALNIEKARQVFKEKVADPLGRPVIEAATAMYELANSMIYDLLHKTTIQRGLDPRRFALFSFGGTAGMHVAEYGAELGVSHIVIPHSASVHGAFGLVVSDIVHEDQTTQPLRPPVDLDVLNSIFASLEHRVRTQLHSGGFADDAIRVTRSIDMRYRRQVHLLTTPVAGEGALTPDTLEQTIALFETLYREKYGEESAYREAGIELVSFRLRGAGTLKKPQFRVHDRGPSDPAAAHMGQREAWVHQARALQPVDTYQFDALAPGHSVPGPAIIWTPITTVVLSPDQVAAVDEYKNLVIARQ
jgi:N-methylhydantoinase A